ncbi:MAG: hypothetical protein HN644_07575 [Rhodospirillales bacterium]|jgi:hypothetical protein|nr:hypothetical protein [Rhodospirillales bacterium]MBT4039703.1 hypothetical protein [Rhodospirillales bacterium]MBT5351188.1 hypothetical protein [Rhodospirillales bacterium]MBT5522102.1 hypothetical protein [Rhodospirillales bacterium]MBT6110078.1 hypothetical protein [Rhodospirillales bacterium]
MKKINNTIAMLFSVALLLTSFSVPIYAAGDLLQCVTDCIMEEGEGEADTCQLRCAKIHVDVNKEPKDCMKIYKQCKKTCDGDKDCKKECKTELLYCS